LIHYIFLSTPVPFLSVSISAVNNVVSCPCIQHQSWRKNSSLIFVESR
jgi:hypothetical protein